jgi:hypothetical protein
MAIDADEALRGTSLRGRRETIGVGDPCGQTVDRGRRRGLEVRDLVDNPLDEA